MAQNIFEEIARLRRERVPAALATVVRTRGSTPAKVPARMLILANGDPLGTVGGGCVEADVIRAARNVMDTGCPKTITFRLSGEEAERTGIACGGIVDIMIEPLEEPRVVIVGAGHVGQAVGQLATKVGFRLTVIDDRPDFASQERFPDADEIVVADLEDLSSSVTIGAQCFVLAMTRAHAEDFAVLRWALTTPARYIGVLGSRSKRLTFMKDLEALGVPASDRESIRMPLGKDIGAETVDEIAIAVVAELIEVRRTVVGSHA